MTRSGGPRVRVHPTDRKLIVEDAGVYVEVEFAVARRLIGDMTALLRTFDPSWRPR